MTLALAKDVEDYLQNQVRNGACTNASELVNDLVRCLRDQHQENIVLTPELEAWLLEAADKPSSPLTEADFAAIRQRVRTKLGT